MKSILLMVLLLIQPCAKVDQRDVTCSVELSVLKSKKFGQLISVVGKIENRTNKKLYFDRGKYLRIDIFKQEGQKYIDFFEGWQSFEIIDKRRDEINKELGESVQKNQVFDSLTGEFTDSTASAFYHKHVKDRRFIKSAKDSAELKEWTKSTFEQVVFLQPQESYKDVTGLNSLPSGLYKIVYSYDNTKQVKPRLPNLILQSVLNGYERWTGVIVSDTLFLNVR